MVFLYIKVKFDISFFVESGKEGMEVKLHSYVETRWREVGGFMLQPLHQWGKWSSVLQMGACVGYRET